MTKAVPGGAKKGNKWHHRKHWPQSNRPFLLSNASLDVQGASSLDTASATLIQWLLCPLVIVASLMTCVIYYGQEFNEDFLSLAVISFLLAAHIFDEANLYRQQSKFPLAEAIGNILLKWALMAIWLWILAIVTKMSGQFPRKPILAWLAVTPVALLVFQLLVRQLMRAVMARGSHRTAIIVGANPLGCELFDKIDHDVYLGIKIIGVFDDRAPARVPPSKREMLIGRIDAVAPYVREHHVDLVYISLPMLAQQRILYLLNGLRDSTASVYFLPDIFLFDLINARFGRINGVPVVSIRDTPYFGVRRLVKRLSDILIASFILLLVFPLMALIAVGVKLSSPGPVLFKQRRYGLDGDEIKVFKFRSMTVTEDDDHIVQATTNDPRVTPFGRFLRKTSLDELPQFINVLQGRMSVVGPRPHAVVHNEMYRKVISGYMIRHKIKPGITGWAQVNGLRGETDSLEKMAERVGYDLEYIRNWSLTLDLWIILKTIKVFFVSDGKAF